MACTKAKSFIPIVDLGGLGIAQEAETSEGDWTRVAKEITEAFERVGFVYLSGHGIPDGQIKKLFEASAAFFNLPQQEKDKYSWDSETFCGYVPVNKEKLNPTSISEMKETFKHQENIQRNYFVDAHTKVFREGNSTALRLINYPPVIGAPLPNSTRCGPHTDYGTITLLFQDGVGGLEVLDQSSGTWLDTETIPGTVLVNIGDLMQFWTSGKFTATKHRVIIPKDEDLQRQSRQSIAFFLNPDDDRVISPLDGSSKFEPVPCKEYIRMRIRRSYQDSSSRLE
ncbi:uncharacterized protein LOC135211458 [Macrobrachium nipponense]|uniref:uncharacterized protein LOC135211458 n=1 Tax=Macrobrachium nipponense TaxID=159736 RepID=UPI0030C82E0D